ncbi:hypothetical protein PHLGIDRAFT_37052 [Phlebiopsis gigantea 11061_1 CR5-6]|uniref:Uncharacterized protein n=1 Tax=Phlebiopsis gigantea (strain 11061_1 CR5-6) TaxID=745531 RepID=A0A0C3NHD5_PHLG1|nr:hypothetical protein PHLGIDRAFT_37052 [Phlebiopsis gigantea 11061_1 CR5-6]
MIILDAEEDQVPKLACPPPIHPVVRRPSTPTPSLPDYETSQEEEHRKTDWKPKPRSRRMRWAIYGLIAYFIVTVAIGVPLIIVKTRRDDANYKTSSMLYPSPAAWGSTNGSGTAGFNLGEMPICVDDATVCDKWDIVDKQDGEMLYAHLEYYVPLSNVMFVQSNVSGPTNTSKVITGSLNVGVSNDPTDTRASVKVLMTYTGTTIREQTSVCLMNLAGSDGLYIYVPERLDAPDHLEFNITMLFPRPNKTSPLYISNFLTSLPYFSQHINATSPQITFGNVALGGVRSNITVDRLFAQAVLIKSPLADITGSVNITDGFDDDDDDS